MRLSFGSWREKPGREKEAFGPLRKGIEIIPRTISKKGDLISKQYEISICS